MANGDSTWRPQGKAHSPTVRDGSNLLFVMAPITVIVSWVLHDGLFPSMPPEVSGAFGGLIGYVVARKLRY